MIQAVLLPARLLLLAIGWLASSPVAASEHRDREPDDLFHQRSASDSDVLRTGTFRTLYEPSGLVRLSRGEFIVIEDEPLAPLRQVSDAMLDSSAGAVTEIDVGSPGWLSGLSLGPLDDLEAVARDGNDRLFVAGSHDDGHQRVASNRQKLLRFSTVHAAMDDIVAVRTLYRDIVAAYPVLVDDSALRGDKSGASINIEALAFDRQRGHLLIGLRTPLLDHHAVIIRLLNPHDYVEGRDDPRFVDSLWTPNLDGGGLRAMCYDDRQDQLLLVSRRETGNKRRFKLWQMSADGKHQAMRLRVPGGKDALDNVEGLAITNAGTGSGRAVVFVRDDGDRESREPASWFVLDRALMVE